MASSSSSSSNPSSSFLPAPDAVQVLVSSLADESRLVRDASMAALKEIAPLNPLLVLNCCLSVSRGGRRRFGNMAGAFVVMASAVHSMDQRDVDPALMGKLAKIATAEMITSKELYADWQRAAASLLVSIGSHDPDLLMEEIFLHMSGPNSSVPAMVQILADFASAEAMQFTPRLKDVLSRVLPILGNVKDAQRPIFANAFKCWFQAAWQYVGDDDAPTHILDSDIMSFLSSVFELLWKVWASSRDLKVRSSSVEALGQMVGLVTRTELKSALPRLVSTILELYKRDQDVIFLATCSLHRLLNATLLSESGPPLLDFEEVTIILCTLLPEACVTYKSDGNSNFSVGLKIYNEVQHCFLEVGSVYPDDLFVFLLNKCQAKDEALTLGALCVVKHLLPRLIESWHSKRPLLIEAAKLLLHEENLGIRKALAELLLVMASHCYLTGSSAELFVEYLVRQCAISDKEIKDFSSSKEGSRRSSVFQPFQYNKLEVKMGDVCPEELRAICEKGLILLAVTIPEMEHMLWPFILKMVIQRKYSAAVATVCRCVSELCRRRSYHNDSMSLECSARSDIPSPEELFARLIVLLHDPLAREQLPTQILTALWHLAPIFPKNISLFWEDEIPKMKAYVSDTDDLKQDTSYQETWDSMVINFLAESLDVIQDSGWIMSLGDAFSRHYELYAPDDEHSGFLHRCLGMLLQKVDDRAYVRDKINWMYKNANISVPTNRLGLAKGMGLVASSHLDTVLEKLKEILNNVGQNKFQRFLSFFSGGIKVDDTDDIHAGLALMYGYAARYAPSTVIEARIDALVGTNMLSRLLHVHHPVAKQAVITAIDLLGQGVINASESGVSFPLKRRDQLLDYTLTLMGVDENDGLVDSGHELLRTLTLALSACTTLVSVEPKLTVETRNRVLKATLGFFALSNDPSDIVEPLIDNLITLLCTILLTSGEDGRSRVEQLLHILRQIDIYVSSPMENQRKRGCTAAYELLVKFRTLCSGGYCGLGCHANCMHKRHTVQRNFSNLPSAYVLPSRDSLSLGERVIVYLPRCADTNSDVRKMASQIICLFFGISLSLPRSMGLTPDIDIEISYNALGSLEDVISILRSDASIDQSEIFNRVVSSVCSLLTKDELVITLHGCTSAICDKVRLSAEGTIQAVVEFIIKRGNELNEADVTRTTQSLLSATMLVTEKYSRQEILNAICCLAESTDSGIIFSEVLATAGRDIITKDISRLRGGWPIQDAFHAFSQHGSLSFLFLEHVISVLNQNPLTKGDAERGDVSGHSIEFVVEKDILQAALLALNSLFRGGGKTGKKAVEKNYATVLSALILQLGSCHGLARSGHLEPLWILLNTFQSFCECMGDLEMGKILARDGEQNDDKWVSLIGELACCISIKRPKEVQPMCAILCKALNRHQRFQRDASASALSEFIRFSDGVPSLLEQMVEAMCLHVSDDSPTVRRLCLRGLVQIPSRQMIHYATQVLSVIVALLEDPDESVQLTAVECALMVLESPPKEAVDPVLLNLSLRLRNLQISTNVKMRSSAFAAYGALCNYSIGAQQEAFFEQVHATLPRLVLHIHDDDSSVRQACWNTLRRMVHLLGLGSLSTLFDGHCFNSNHRSHYEDFVRDVTRQICQNFSAKADVYMSSAIQAFDAPWPIIQANAIYFSSCMLTLLEDHRSWAPYLSQVVGMLISKMSRSPDAVVRATCSSALSLLLRISNSLMLTTVQIDRSDSASEGSQSRMSL